MLVPSQLKLALKSCPYISSFKADIGIPCSLGVWGMFGDPLSPAMGECEAGRLPFPNILLLSLWLYMARTSECCRLGLGIATEVGKDTGTNGWCGNPS